MAAALSLIALAAALPVGFAAAGEAFSAGAGLGAVFGAAFAAGVDLAALFASALFLAVFASTGAGAVLAWGFCFGAGFFAADFVVEAAGLAAFFATGFLDFSGFLGAAAFFAEGFLAAAAFFAGTRRAAGLASIFFEAFFAGLPAVLVAMAYTLIRCDGVSGGCTAKRRAICTVKSGRRKTRMRCPRGAPQPPDSFHLQTGDRTRRPVGKRILSLFQRLALRPSSGG
ncbi:MAG: hypothetical protein RIA10_11295 [Amphiplicatus sp.]